MCIIMSANNYSDLENELNSLVGVGVDILMLGSNWSQNMLAMVSNLVDARIWTYHRCRFCNDQLQWAICADNPKNYKLCCLDCDVNNSGISQRSIMEFDHDDAVRVLSKALTKYHPQIVASYLNSIISNVKNIFLISTPYILPNPFHIFESIMANEVYDYVLLGGRDPTILVADLYTDENVNQFPILYLTTNYSRFFVSAIHNTVDTIGTELKYILSSAVKRKSYLVIGKQLQKLLRTFNLDQISCNNLKIITYEQLRMVERNNKLLRSCSTGRRRIGISRIFIEITTNCRKLCSLANKDVQMQIESNGITDREQIFQLQQRSLTTAVWIKEMIETPFIKCIDAYEQFTSTVATHGGQI